MTFAIVENVPTPWESIFKLFPASQLPYRARIKQIQNKYYPMRKRRTRHRAFLVFVGVASPSLGVLFLGPRKNHLASSLKWKQ